MSGDVVGGRTVERREPKGDTEGDHEVGRPEKIGMFHALTVTDALRDSRVDSARGYARPVPQEPHEELRDRLAKRIREVAKRRGITLTDLADRAGVSQAAFWEAMSGRSGPSIDFVAKVAAALDVDPDELVKRYRKPRSRAT